MRKILVIHGPNLNLLGEREPEIYGSRTLEEINEILEDQVESEGLELEFFQSNHEGALIDCIHENRKSVDGILINPAAYSHTSVALRDAISAVKLPAVEVHFSDTNMREDFRKISLVRGVCAAHFMGEGIESYKKGLAFLIQLFKDKEKA